MPAEPLKPGKPTTLRIEVPEAEGLAKDLTAQFAGRGWNEFESMACALGCRRARLTQALRWLKCESALFIVESRISCGIAKVRISKVSSDEKQARQLSTEIISQLAKLYANLKHTQRNREKLAHDVKTIASRVAPFLENREFQIQYRRYMRQVNKPHPETQMDGGSEIPEKLNIATLPHSPTYQSHVRNEGPTLQAFDRRSPLRLILMATIAIVALIVAVFLASTFFHSLEVLSRYVDRINSHADF